MKKLLVLIALMLTLASCSRETTSYPSSGGSDNSFVTDGAFEESFDEAYDKVEGSSQDLEVEQKISYRVSLNVETLDLESTVNSLTTLIEKYDAYVVESSFNEKSEYRNKSVYYEIKVPTEHYEEFLDNSDEIGNIIRKNISQTNLTSSYIDITTRLENLEIQEKRLLELLEEAENISDVLSIEQQLSNVRYQIENYTRQLENLESIVDYTTFSISIEEDSVLVNDSFLTRLGNAFTNSGVYFVNALQNIIITIVSYLPVILILAAVIVVIVRVRRKRK